MLGRGSRWELPASWLVCRDMVAPDYQVVLPLGGMGMLLSLLKMGKYQGALPLFDGAASRMDIRGC